MPVLRQFALSLAIALGPALPGDDAPRATGVAVPSDPVFTALLTDGTTVSGQVRRLGEKEGLTLVSDQGVDQPVPADRLVKLTREGASPPTNAEGGEIVLFPDGDRLARCKIGKTGEFNLAVHSFALDDLSIPLDGILGLILNTPSDPASADALIARVRTEPRDTEMVWLANGDKLPGLFAGLDDKKLTFQASTGKIELPRTDSGVLAIGFAQGQVAYRRPDGPFFELTLLDGSRLGVTKARLERGQVVGTTRLKAEVRLPIGELALVHAMNGPVAYLSDRETGGAIYEAYVGPTRDYRRNATVSGEVLRVGGRPFDRGLGTQSRTVLVYKLEPGAKRFQAQVALDDRAGPLGSVVFKVQVDRTIRYESPPMASGEPARFIDVDLAGAKALVLMTEFGERGDVQDHADWIEARIIR
jgi:hypothetical protein